MNSLAILCLLSLCLLSQAWKVANVTTPLNSTTHNVNFSVDCGVNAYSVLVAVWPGLNQNVVPALNISLIVNSTYNFSADLVNEKYYIYENNSALAQTWNLTNLTADKVRNIGRTYSFSAYCNAGNDTATNYSDPFVGSWVQPDNSGENLFVDVIYNGSLSQDNLTVLLNAQYGAILALGLQAYQLVNDTNLPSSVNGNNFTIRTYVSKDVYSIADQTETFVSGNVTNDNLSKNISDSIVALHLQTTVLSIGYTLTTPPTVNLTLQAADYTSLSFGVSGTGSGYLYVVLANAPFVDTYLTAENIENGVDANGNPFLNNKIVNVSNGLNVSLWAEAQLSVNASYSVYYVTRDLFPGWASSLSAWKRVDGNTTAWPNVSVSYNVSVGGSVDLSTLVASLTVNCSLPSLSAALIATFGPHPVVVSNLSDFTCGGNSNWVNANNTYLCLNQTGNNLSQFSFQINPSQLRNLGWKYSLQAICKNATNYSTAGNFSWTQPDNGGQVVQISVIYNGNLNQSLLSNYSQNQSNALAQYLTGVPSSLIVNGSDSSASPVSVFARSLSRSLVDGQATTIVTYVLRNYSVANDNLSQVINASIFNTTLVIQNLTAYYNNQSNSDLANISNVTISIQANPQLQLFTVTSNNSNGISFQLGSNVQGDYVIVSVSTSDYNYSSALSPDDVFNYHDENNQPFDLHQEGKVNANQNITVDVGSLNANTTYNFFAVVRDSTPAQQYSPIVWLSSQTTLNSFAAKVNAFLGLLVLGLMALILN